MIVGSKRNDEWHPQTAQYPVSWSCFWFMLVALMHSYSYSIVKSFFAPDTKRLFGGSLHERYALRGNRIILWRGSRRGNGEADRWVWLCPK